MDMGWLIPVGIVGAVSARHAFTTWVAAKHGYPIEGRHGRRLRRADNDGTTDLEAERKILLLSGENERLTGQVSRLEERIAVLERIATDPATRIAHEIDALRDR